MKRWRVYIAQVNQTYVEVKAETEEQAEERAVRKWAREYGGARVLGRPEEVADERPDEKGGR